VWHGEGVAIEERPGDPSEDRHARFEALATQVIEPLRRYLVRRTDPATADDALAETLLVCWRRLDDVPDGDPLPWAYGVARNCLANAERAERRQRRVAARISVVDPPAESTRQPVDGADAVVEALAAVRPEEAELLRLWAWEQLGASEIATVLGISPNAVSIRLHRARQHLKEELRKIEAPSGHEETREGNGS
jgi:RNA polymerase sigma-70 factor (ECF subfamily)